MSIPSARIARASCSSDQPDEVAPRVDQLAATRGDRVGDEHRGVGEDLELPAVVRLQKRQEEPPHRMRAEIGRHVTYPQAASGRAIVAVRLDQPGQRLGVLPVPAAMFLVNRPGVAARAEKLSV